MGNMTTSYGVNGFIRTSNDIHDYYSEIVGQRRLVIGVSCSKHC
jgi:hypothetical protein